MIVLFFILGILAIVGGVFLFVYEHPVWGGTCAAVALALFILADSIAIVPTGYTGVSSMFGQIKETPVPSGFNWKAPFVESIKLVNNKQQDQTYSNKVWSETSEQTVVYAENITVTE